MFKSDCRAQHNKYYADNNIGFYYSCFHIKIEERKKQQKYIKLKIKVHKRRKSSKKTDEKL